MHWKLRDSFECPRIDLPDVDKNTSSHVSIEEKYNSNEASFVRFDREGKLIAVGSSDGVLRIFGVDGPSRGKEVAKIRINDEAVITCLQWVYNEDSVVRDTIAVTMGDGSIVFCHVPSKRIVWEHKIEDESLMCIDFCENHKLFAVAGKRAEIRLFAEEAKKEIMVMSAHHQNGYKAHSNRIMTLRFVPLQPSKLLSCGLDKSVWLWDVVKGLAIQRLLQGDDVSPLRDCLEVSPDGKRMLTASFRKGAPLQVWETDASQGASQMSMEVALDGVNKTYDPINPLRMQAQIDTSEVNTSSLHCARWTPSGALIVTGGSGINAARAFVRHGGVATSNPVASETHPIDTGSWQICGYSEYTSRREEFLNPVKLQAVDVFEPLCDKRNTPNWVPSNDAQWISGCKAAVAIGQTVSIYDFRAGPFEIDQVQPKPHDPMIPESNVNSPARSARDQQPKTNVVDESDDESDNEGYMNDGLGGDAVKEPESDDESMEDNSKGRWMP